MTFASVPANERFNFSEGKISGNNAHHVPPFEVSSDQLLLFTRQPDFAKKRKALRRRFAPSFYIEPDRDSKPKRKSPARLPFLERENNTIGRPDAARFGSSASCPPHE